MSIAHVVLASALVPAAVVFGLAYRHALEHWLAPTEVALPVAIVAARPRDARIGFTRRFHAAAIALAFVSLALMALMAVGMVVLAVAT